MYYNFCFSGTNVNSNDYYGRNPLQLAQSKLKLLQQGSSADSVQIKMEVRKVSNHFTSVLPSVIINSLWHSIFLDGSHEKSVIETPILCVLYSILKVRCHGDSLLAASKLYPWQRILRLRSLSSTANWRWSVNRNLNNIVSSVCWPILPKELVVATLDTGYLTRYSDI